MIYPNPRSAPPILTVSLGDIGGEEWRIQIPMERIQESLLSSDLERSQPLSSTSSSGTKSILERLLKRVEAVDSISISNEALNGGYDDPPIAVALQLMKLTVVSLVMEELDQCQV